MVCEKLNWSRTIPYTATNANLVPEVGGVYEVWRREGTKWHRVYVGKAETLRQRFTDHLSSNEKNRCLKARLASSNCHFRYVRVTTGTARERIEGHLLSRFHYECNQQTSSSTGSEDILRRLLAQQLSK